MKSLAFSVGNCTPKHLTPLRIRNIVNSQMPTSNVRVHGNDQQRFCQQLQLKEGQTLLRRSRRREAVGLGLLVGLLDVVWQPVSSSSSSNIAVAEEALCDLTTSPSGLAFCDKVVGTGPEPIKGQLIKAHYVGKLENGKIFDSSYNRGKPLTFRVGVGEVIRGWDDGILGSDGVPPMLAGGKRRLKLPPQLGYGMRGAGCRGGSCIIPPDSVLLFDIEFIGKAS
ncbi:hypothetical protein Tsubulata_000907 [Turnera subulata]|uniref:peptidylprolyl isomerase n=1 Tax=Turnera subulata TaxID=218843 RepID=A0A9Q0F359_9ROSI|nr:hypothetical protein Tsubulata_000907 [Turnera subulata]